MSNRPLVLVDGSSYLYRAFHALPPLNASDGQPTGAVLGVLNMLYRLLDDFDPEYIAVIFDAPGKTFRDDLYADYKANRPPMPDDLRQQIDPLNRAIELMGIPLLRIGGVEADDVIGTLAAKASESELNTVISTSDKDMAQLVGDRITLVNTMSGTKLDREGVIKKFGVPPERIVDYLALVGDTSDNIPGVPGVGPKTAEKWLAQFGSLDDVIAHADEIKGKVGERLREAIPQIPLYRELVTIKLDVELPTAVDALKVTPPDVSALRQLYERLELRNLLRRLDAGDPVEPTKDPQGPGYETILDEASLKAWIKRLTGARLSAVDTETTSLDYMKARLVGISFAVGDGEAAYLPMDHQYPGAPDQMGTQKALTLLKPWLESTKSKKVGHHLKYDAHVLRNHDIELRGIEFDTMLESYVLNSTAGRHDMDSVAKRYLGVDTIHYEDVVGKGAKQLNFSEVDIGVATDYAAEDADVTLKLHESLWNQLGKVDELRSVYETIEQPLVEVLRRMEYTGVLVDGDLLKKQSQQFAETMLELEAAAHDEAGGPFNLGSPKQLQEILYDRLELPILGKTSKGQPSTAESVLQELAEEHALPRLILEYRGLAKLKSTYTDKLPLQINPSTGRIHSSYHQAVAATGRLSSSDPNLQNIPIRSEQGRRIRTAFVAPKGYRLVAADYSQIELRIMAHLSADAGLKDAFQHDQDIHRATAAEVFSMIPDEVSDDQRRSAKAINFGLIYGMSAFGLAKQLNISRHEAQAYVDRYFERYPGVKEYMDRTRLQGREQGFVSTVFGRRLYLPDIRSRNAPRRQYAERSAINAPMQGTAADIIKRAMIQVDDAIQNDKLDAKIIMQVHDELVFEVAEAQEKKLIQLVTPLMEGAADLDVPLKVDVGTGNNWDQAH